jgi:hypothetical protein
LTGYAAGGRVDLEYEQDASALSALPMAWTIKRDKAIFTKPDYNQGYAVMNSKGTEKISCFLYREGLHFTLPPEIAYLAPRMSEFVLRAPDGTLAPSPEVFYETANPDAAFFFLFPYDLGQYIDSNHLQLCENLIAGLPYLEGREKRHIVCDYGDKTFCITPPVCLFKVSLLKTQRHLAVPLWYSLPRHTLKAGASFDWSAIRYAVSFVGANSHIVRRIMLASIRKQAPELKVFFNLRDELKVAGGYFFKPSKNPEEAQAEQAIFLKSIAESFSVLCPPGVGPQSIRLYETMALGRIPVIFGAHAAYPLEGRPEENMIDYDSFCLRIPEEEILNTGSILKNFFAQTSEEELRARCVLACRIWNRRFAAGKLRTLLNEAQRKFAL